MLLFLIFAFFGCSQGVNFKMLREKMVKEQIIARGVKDKNVLDAMRKIPREEFVPEEERKYAYGDYPLSIGFSQTISQPYIVAFMTELLELTPDDRVLEIGTGSGYQAAVLAEIAKEVYTIEIIPELSKRAEETLERLGYKNVEFKIGDGFLGWNEFAPFDKIILTCAPKEIPKPLIEQLKDGGRMVLPVGEGFQYLKVVKKNKGKIKVDISIPVRFVPMLGIDRGEIRLPEPNLNGQVSLEKTINKRVSMREYADKELYLKDLSQVIWAAAGKRYVDGVSSASRVFPSAGAIYPFKFYVMVNNVYGIPEGIYMYDYNQHVLKLFKKGDYRKELLKACFGQDMVYNSSFNIIIVGDTKSAKARYGERGLRYLFIDAGHSGENIYLQCASRGLGTVAIGAFDDDRIKKLLDLEKSEIPVYVFPVGKIKE